MRTGRRLSFGLCDLLGFCGGKFFTSFIVGSVFVIILLVLLAFKVLFLLFPGVVLAAARAGLLLWFNNVMPALLPFMIIANLFIGLGFARFLGQFLQPLMKRVFCLPGIGGFAFIVGLTSGYPMGAKTVADLYRNKELNAKEAQHLLAFCNNAGPVFILGAVGVGMFGSSTVGYVLWAGHVLAAVVLGVLLRRKQQGEICPSIERHSRQKFPLKDIPIGKALGESVKSAMEAMAVIGGLIIFFAVVVAVLGEIGLPDQGLLAGVISGAIEVTGGVHKISLLEQSIITVGFSAFVIAFGGMSIHMQTLHFIDGTGIKTLPYILCKILHGILAAVITGAIYFFVVK